MIIINGKEACINDLINALTDEGGELDFDTLGAAMDGNILDAVMESFEGERYTVFELIQAYLNLAIDLEVKI